MKLLIIFIANITFLLSNPAFAKGASNARSAVSGKYVTKSYASNHRSTTVVERKKK